MTLITFPRRQPVRTFLVSPKGRSIPASTTLFRVNAAFAYIQPLSEDEFQELLQQDEEQIGEAWDKYSGLPGLLDAEVELPVKTHARIRSPYSFDPISARYRYLSTGRLVPEASIRNGVLRLSNGVRNELRSLTEQLVAGNLTPDRWYRQTLKILRNTYRDQWISAIGGRKFYDRRQWKLFGNAAAPQYRWLNNFLLEIQSGKQPLNGRAVMRSGMYARAGNGMYWQASLDAAKARGMRYVKRVLGETDQHCRAGDDRPGCVELARKGWVLISQLVPIGSASCLSNCLCSLQFSKAKPKPKPKPKKAKPKPKPKKKAKKK